MKKLVGICFAVFAIALLTSFFLVFSLLNIFHEFEIVSGKTLLCISGVVSIIFAIICVISIIILFKSEKKTKLGHWLNINGSKLFLAYILLIVFFYSIKAEVFLTIEDMKELISLEWVILGTSITVFLIWHVITIEYLEKKLPVKPQSVIPTKKILYIQKKEAFYSDATMLLNNANLLFINLIGLIIATAYVYVTSRTANLFSQTLVTAVLLLCTNTVIGLVADIFKLFNERKKAMLQATKTTSADVELQNAIFKDAEELLTAVDVIKKLDNIEDDDKNRLISEILQKFNDTYIETPHEKTLTTNGKNYQL